jgi:hypothetical protein
MFDQYDVVLIVIMFGTVAVVWLAYFRYTGKLNEAS